MTETAIMLSRLAPAIGGEPDRNLVLAFDGSYHGLGIGACSLSGITARIDFCGPFAPGVHHVSPAGQLDREHKERPR